MLRNIGLRVRQEGKRGTIVDALPDDDSTVCVAWDAGGAPQWVPTSRLHIVGGKPDPSAKR